MSDSNYGPNDNDEGNRQQPRDTTAEPVSPVRDVFGQSAVFGDEDPWANMTEEERVLAEFKQGVTDKFHGIWKSAFK